MNNYFNHKSVLGGLALLTLTTSCSITKHFSSQSNIANNIAHNIENNIDVDLRNKNSIEYKIDSIQQEANKRFSTDSINSRIIKNLEAYKPIVNTMPEDVFIIGHDTIDCRYTSAGPADSARLAHNAIVIRNASRLFPASRPYLKYIIESCDKYRNTFDIPPELMIAILRWESNGNQYAVSTANARGAWQFTRETAEGMGMTWSLFQKYPKLYSLEKNIIRLAQNYYHNSNAARTNLSANKFDLAEKYELTADSLLIQYNAANVAFAEEIKNIGSKIIEKSSQVFDIPKSTDNAVKYMAGLARQFQRRFHCTDEQALLWAKEAYNSGYSTVIEGIKFGLKPFKETKDYTRSIAATRAEIYPIYKK
jgi:hypothetical protein